MEFEGTVYKVLPVVKGTSQRGEWMKQEVVFELPGEFNRKICVGFWGDKAPVPGVADMPPFAEEGTPYSGEPADDLPF